jgi:hypothetical protein
LLILIFLLHLGDIWPLGDLLVSGDLGLVLFVVRIFEIPCRTMVQVPAMFAHFVFQRGLGSIRFIGPCAPQGALYAFASLMPKHGWPILSDRLLLGDDRDHY